MVDERMGTTKNKDIKSKNMQHAACKNKQANKHKLSVPTL